jgi:hypothetical protein
MPNQSIALAPNSNAKRASFILIRHSPGFGIAGQVVRRQLFDGCFGGELMPDVPDDLLGDVQSHSEFS